MAVTLESVRDKVRSRERLDREEGLFLLSDVTLLDLGQLAMEERRRRHPDPVVTFVIDTNPNYTNVCNVDCTFCAFYRSPGQDDAYTHSVEEMLERIGRSADKGVTTVLMQGGVNPELPFEYYLDLVRGVRERYPGVTPHFWSAVEIEGMAAVSGLSLQEVLHALKDAGQTTIPGGGAEILSERVRKKISHKKNLTSSWLEVHREAHALGFRSTATMMYGHVETDEDVHRALSTASVHFRTNTVDSPPSSPGASSPGTLRSSTRSRATPVPTTTCACWPHRGSTSTTSITSRPHGSRKARRRVRSLCTGAPTISAARCSKRTSTPRPASSIRHLLRN